MMQYKVLCLLLGGGLKERTWVCLLSSFQLFRTRYVRYLMAFWWMFIMRFSMLDFGVLSLFIYMIGCLCIIPLYSGRDGYEGIYFPSIIV